MEAGDQVKLGLVVSRCHFADNVATPDAYWIVVLGM